MSAKVSVDSSNRLVTEEEDAVNGLLGLRYLTQSDVTWIIEYYRNGSGYTDTELERFLRLAKSDPLAVSRISSTWLGKPGNRALVHRTPARAISTCGRARRSRSTSSIRQRL